MRSSLRRFVYLIVDGERPSTCDLHRVDMSRIFTLRSPTSPLTVSAAIEDARLPPPKITFDAPSSEHRSGIMNFMLLGRDKVLATDQTGRASIYDAGLHALRPAHTLSTPKHRPVSVAVGDRLCYVLDSITKETGVDGESELSFEAIALEYILAPNGYWCHDWRCHSLPRPPYRPADIGAYAVVSNSDIWVSTDEGTYSFDASGGAWMKKGDWTLPFQGLAHYVPEHRLWVGLSNKHNCVCAFDLTVGHSPLVAHNVWEDIGPLKECIPVKSFLVHLGATRFCIARLFCMDDTRKMIAVFTGVEMEQPSSCGNTSNGHQMVMHKSLCYKLSDIVINQWIF